MSCCCGCNPCLKYPCCITSTTTTIPVPPQVTCEEVAVCVKEDLQNLIAGQENQIDVFCDASVKCINDALENIPLGLPSGLPNLNAAVFTILTALPGYTNSGTIKLGVIDGVMQWISE